MNATPDLARDAANATTTTPVHAEAAGTSFGQLRFAAWAVWGVIALAWFVLQ
jgi:hypothetical protein